jgi:hypothetical protein
VRRAKAARSLRTRLTRHHHFGPIQSTQKVVSRSRAHTKPCVYAVWIIYAPSRIHQRSARQENFQSDADQNDEIYSLAQAWRAPQRMTPTAHRWIRCHTPCPFRVAADAYLNDFICTDRLKWVHACRTCPTTVLLPLLLLANGTAGLRASTRLRLFGQIRAQSREGLLNTGHALFSAPATMSDFTASAAR